MAVAVASAGRWLLVLGVKERRWRRTRADGSGEGREVIARDGLAAVVATERQTETTGRSSMILLGRKEKIDQVSGLPQCPGARRRGSVGVLN